MNKEICLLGVMDKDKREKLGYYLFFAGIMLELLVMVTDNAAYYTIPYRGRILQVAFLLFFCKILLSEYRIYEWLVIIGLGFLGTISYLACDDKYVIRLVVLLIAGKGVQLRKIIICICLVTLASTVIIAFFSFFSISGPLVDIRNYGRGGVETRYSFGFNHANNIHSILWYLLVLMLLIKKNVNGIVGGILLTLANIGLYCLTLSRTGLLITEMLIIGSVWLYYYPFKKINILLYIFSDAFYFGCIGLTVHSAKNSINVSRIEAFFDKLLTGRLQMVSENAGIAKWQLLPGVQVLENLDNGIAKIFCTYGIIIGAVFSVWIIYLGYVSYRRSTHIFGVVLLTSMCELFMESTFVISESLLCNTFVILALVMMSTDMSTIGGKENGIQEPGIS